MNFTTVTNESFETRLIEDDDLAVAIVTATAGRPDSIGVTYLHFDEERPYVLGWVAGDHRASQGVGERVMTPVPCPACPWRVGADPADIPRLDLERARRLDRTCPDETSGLGTPMMACHGSSGGQRHHLRGVGRLAGFGALDPSACRHGPRSGPVPPRRPGCL